MKTKVKSILIIGMGRFGRHLARKLTELGHDVMVVDKRAPLIEQLSSEFTNALIGDFTSESVVASVGVSNFDLCFVCIGEDFQSSLVITSLLKKNGAKYVVAKANQEIQEDLLLKIGADEVVYPEREIAEKLAVRFNMNNIFDCVSLTSEYSIYEVPILREWVGQTIAEINVRKRYQVSIIAIKCGSTLKPMPAADYVFGRDDHIVVIGKSGNVFRLTAKA